MYKARYTALIVLIGCLSLLSACAFGKFGSADMTYTDIRMPLGITPKVTSKSDTLNVLGAPDCVMKEGQKETWVYKNQCGFFVVLYGKTKAKDLVVDFVGNKVDSYRLVDKGESTGIFATPGSVAK